MKPYFLKWLPVKGEVKEGVTVLLDGKTPAVVGPAAPDLFEGCPVVKLFLCSRDIRLEEMLDSENKAQIHVYHDGSEPPFKVIGEISPDALGYVKEGDEFSEDQVQYWPLKGGTVPSYRIKGPCGHFH